MWKITHILAVIVRKIKKHCDCVLQDNPSSFSQSRFRSRIIIDRLSLTNELLGRKFVFNSNFQKSSSVPFLTCMYTYLPAIFQQLVRVSRYNYLTFQRNRSNVGLISEVPAGAKQGSFAPLLRARNFSTGKIDGRERNETIRNVYGAILPRSQYLQWPEPLRSLTPGTLSFSRPQDAAVAHHPTAVRDRHSARYPSSLNWASSRSG